MAGRTSAGVLTFGVGPASDADVRADIVTLDGTLRPHLHLHTPWGGVELTLAVCGAHQAANAVAAAACGLALGVDIDDVVEALEVATISGQRMEVDLTADGALLIDDAYNANPTSTRAALDALAAVPGATRRVAVLGVMAELGPASDELHRAIAAHAAALGIRVVSVAAPAYGIEGPDAVDDVDGALDRLGPIGERDAVLVKGSRVAALERVSAALRSPTAAAAPGRA
jgi:UDP-N-acetylmuramoyl-tripeptide--D-alanyl-D-alanine ligase